jgi:hypothetical protein
MHYCARMRGCSTAIRVEVFRRLRLHSLQPPLFAIFCYETLKMPANGTAQSRSPLLKFMATIFLESLLGPRVGFQCSLKYCGVVFVHIPQTPSELAKSALPSELRRRSDGKSLKSPSWFLGHLRFCKALPLGLLTACVGYEPINR